jgi:hypothetical protein
VLLGFQLRSVFQEEFARVPEHTKTWDGIALILLVVVVGVADRPWHPPPGRLLGLALFALNIGLNIFIVIETMVEPVWAVSADFRQAPLLFGSGLGLSGLH